MEATRRSLNLKCLTAAVALAFLAAPTAQAAAAISPRGPAPVELTPRLYSVTAPQHPGPNKRPNGSAGSYFWTEASITAALLGGIFALGLWGDVAIGSVIFGIQLLGSGAALTARTIGARAREASSRVVPSAQSFVRLERRPR